MKCTVTVKEPVKSIGLERTNSNHQFDYDDFDYVWRNGIRVPVLHQIWLGGCNYAKAIEFYGNGPHVRCFYYEGTRRVDQCLKVYKSQIDDRYWCYFDSESDTPPKELFRNRKQGVEITDNGIAEIHMERREWIEPRTVYRANKLLRNPETCLHESIAENDCRAVDEPVPEAPTATLKPATSMDPVTYVRSCGCNK